MSENTKTIQTLCPNFQTRTPYLVILVSTSISIWLSVLVFVLNQRSDGRDDGGDGNVGYTNPNDTSIELGTIPTHLRPDVDTKAEKNSCTKYNIRSITPVIKNLVLVLLTVYTTCAFWWNLYLDFDALFLDGNNGKWICYIIIFSSSPNFKHMICSAILSYVYVKDLQKATANEDKFKLLRLYFTILAVLLPGVIFYTMPWIYVLISMLILTGFLMGGARGCGGNNICNEKRYTSKLLMLALVVVGAFVCGMVFLGDRSVCIIHGLDWDSCNDYRLEWSEYFDIIQRNTVDLLRMITFFDISIF